MRQCDTCKYQRVMGISFYVNLSLMNKEWSAGVKNSASQVRKFKLHTH